MDAQFWFLVNEACAHWHAAYSAAAIAIRIGTAALMGATISATTETYTKINNIKL